MSNTKQSEATVTTTEVLSPYGAAKFVNQSLKDAGLTKVIPPQMMYNYTSARLNAGKTPFIAYSVESGVDREDLQRWTDAYVTKQKALALPVATSTEK